MTEIYERHFTVRSYEVDYQGSLHLVTLLNFLQQVAGEHASLLGASLAELLPRGLTWVISRYHLRMERYPRSGETILLRTWPSQRQGRFALREFELFDQKQECIAVATSPWMLLDLKRLRPVAVEKELPQFPIVTRRALDDPFPSLPAPQTVDIELPFRVRMGDLDINNHVNNTAYAEWAVETVPAAILQGYRPSEIEICFKASAVYGDRILSHTEILQEGPQPLFLHRLVCDRGGHELTRVRSAWQPLASMKGKG